MGEAKRRKRTGTYPTTSVVEAELKRSLVELANANEARMDGTMGPVLELIAANDVVFGVWQDPSEPHGVGVLVVKGANRMREVAASNTPSKAAIAAIKCSCLEQAEALRQHVNTDPMH